MFFSVTLVYCVYRNCFHPCLSIIIEYFNDFSCRVTAVDGDDNQDDYEMQMAVVVAVMMVMMQTNVCWWYKWWYCYTDEGKEEDEDVSYFDCSEISMVILMSRRSRMTLFIMLMILCWCGHRGKVGWWSRRWRWCCW